MSVIFHNVGDVIHAWNNYMCAHNDIDSCMQSHDTPKSTIQNNNINQSIFCQHLHRESGKASLCSFV